MIFVIILNIAAVAQMVEQRIRNAKVTSSIPVSGTIKMQKDQQLTRVCFWSFFFVGLLDHFPSVIRV